MFCQRIAPINSRLDEVKCFQKKAYAAEEGVTLEFPEPHLAIDINRETIPNDFTQIMLEREALVLELLIQEGYFECGGKLHENTQNDIV